MKKIILVIFVLLGLNSIAQVPLQQNVNLTTGTGGVGTADPIWTSVAGPAGNTTPVVTSGLGAWASNACGKWISPAPYVNGGVPNSTAPAGNYTYSMNFSAQALSVTSAVITLNFVGADNSLTNISV